ncbi:phosphotransferase family protein [Aneurinibacillus sp. Ricciae_BoGa-3]|uniref:phosphotransferase family protein n=1 Tax=Aneurinibacillus sp. Ricciae_BoGa-3 TaxID=3022697 RepID=UPI002340C025|nr:phosphotransferase family protein [Aneurinibacillus sp. Ricciae_BoGa-3]WCK52792.1 phosphotransferase family protein [Aneurinibacillus sp. Ricciae_BoGa-3]
MKDTIAVRTGEELDATSVEFFVKQHIPEAGNGQLEIEQFSAGKSNLTYLLRCGNWEGVLRRPPFGPVAPKAHDMERECRILQKIHPVFPLAPRPYIFTDDASIIGAPFYIMERRKGIVLDSSFPPGFDNLVDTLRDISYAVVDTLVDLHAINYKEAGLEDIGRPDGFMQRQVQGWIQRYEKAKTEDVPQVETLQKWLMQRLPQSQGTTIVHNDFKLNNMMLAEEDPVKVAGVFDWEMSTIGDPLLDVGVALSYWSGKEDPPALRNGFKSVTEYPGFITKGEFIERYAEKSGRDLSEIRYYQIFAYFKLAVICQQIYYRWKKGQTQDERFAPLGQVAVSLIRHAVSLI